MDIHKLCIRVVFNDSKDIINGSNEVLIKKELNSSVKLLNHHFSLKDGDLEFKLLEDNTKITYDFKNKEVDYELYVSYDDTKFIPSKTDLFTAVFNPISSWIPLTVPDGGIFDMYKVFERRFHSLITDNTCEHDYRYDKIDDEGRYNWCAKCGDKHYTSRKVKYL